MPHNALRWPTQSELIDESLFVVILIFGRVDGLTVVRWQGVSAIGCSNPNIKVYALSANNGAEVRVVFVKKNGTSPAAVTITLQGAVTVTFPLQAMVKVRGCSSACVTPHLSGSYGSGSLRVLTGSSVTAPVQNITLAGQQASVKQRF